MATSTRSRKEGAAQQAELEALFDSDDDTRTSTSASAPPRPLPLPRFAKRQPPVKTLVELKMLEVFNAIAQKPEWERKVGIDAIVEKWRAEIAKSTNMPDANFEYVLAMLRHAEQRHAGDPFRQSPVQDVFESSEDTFPAALQVRLQGMVKLLEQETPVDWHPHSGQIVRDLVHPSM